MNKEKVLKKLHTLTEEEMQTWLKNLPDDEAIEAAHILNAFAKSSPLYKTDNTFRKEVADIENKVQQFQETVLDEQVHNLMQEVEIDAHLKKLDNSYEKVRASLLDEIKRQPEKIEEIKKIAFGLIEIEKEYNAYEPEKWKPLFDVL